jgi:O-antigen ligase
MTTAHPATRSVEHRTHTILLYIEWVCLLAGVLLCMLSQYYYREINLALFLLGSSWFVRWVRIRRLTRSTSIDIPLLLFLISLLISYSVNPVPATAFVRLSLFFAAISLFYALVNSPLRSIDTVLTLLIILLAFTSLFLIGQYDWSLEPTRFSFQKSIGMQLNRLIPDLELELPSWDALRNILASMLGLFLSFLIFQIYRAYNQGESLPEPSKARMFIRIKVVFLVLMGFVLILSLLLTESRAPWLVYAILMGLFVWWRLSRRLGERVGSSHLPIYLAGIVLSVLILVVFSSLLPQDFRVISLLPGQNPLTGRFEIYPQSTYLASDVPYTGGGLGAFTALYSYYIRVIPFYAFFTEDTGTSLYLYILVEQGWLGLLGLIFLLVIPLYAGLVYINREEIADKGYIAAGMFGVGFIILHGIIHALLGASRAIPFLLLPAGMIFASLGATQEGVACSLSSLHSRLTRRRMVAFTIPIILLLAYLLVAPAPRSAWYANLGAIHMARIQLAGWPTETWEDGSNLPALASSEALFQKSLALNPHNRTANHRLGLIALLRQDFSAAVRFLEAAYQTNPWHRGVIKSLGYALIWKGEIEHGIELLRMIPEAAQEMDAFIFWWRSLERHDISARAFEARDRLLSAP